jgi:CRP/FNR family transcriptional regulator, cyclic AMP receptor protein
MRRQTSGEEPREALARAGWLRELPRATVTQLLAMGRARRLGHDAVIYARGDQPAGLYGVLHGRVHLTVVAADGRELLAAIFGPGSWFGEISLLDGRQRFYCARAVGETEVLVVPRRPLLAFLDAEPRVYRHIAILLCQRLRDAFAYVEEAMFLPLSTRLVRRLLGLAEEYGVTTPRGTRLALRLPQEELGRMLGASRQSVSKELKALEARGWIDVAYGTVVIRDRDALDRTAQARS